MVKYSFVVVFDQPVIVGQILFCDNSDMNVPASHLLSTGIVFSIQ
jgi:hypothetical protein